MGFTCILGHPQGFVLEEVRENMLRVLFSLQVIFDKEQTFQLMHCLEEITTMRKLQKKTTTDSTADKQVSTWLGGYGNGLDPRIV